MTALQKFLNVLLRTQSVLSCIQSVILPHSGIFPHGGGAVDSGEHRFIFGQNELKGSRLYLAKAELTACEVIAVYNAMIFLGCPKRFEQVKREYFRRGALTLWFFGFFGGNPYSIKRVLKSFGIGHETVTSDGMDRDGDYIISFFNGKHPSYHTVFFTCKGGKWLSYNMHSNDRRPMPFDPKKIEQLFIRGYRLEHVA